MVQSTLFCVFSSVSKAPHCFRPKPNRPALAHGICGEIKSANFKLERLQRLQDCFFCQGGCSEECQ